MTVPAAGITIASSATPTTVASFAKLKSNSAPAPASEYFPLIGNHLHSMITPVCSDIAHFEGKSKKKKTNTTKKIWEKF